jgi:hypothetical protein
MIGSGAFVLLLIWPTQVGLLAGSAWAGQQLGLSIPDLAVWSGVRVRVRVVRGRLAPQPNRCRTPRTHTGLHVSPSLRSPAKASRVGADR